MYFGILCTSWIENSEYAERVVLVLTQRKRMLLKIVVLGGV